MLVEISYASPLKNKLTWYFFLDTKGIAIPPSSPAVKTLNGLEGVVLQTVRSHAVGRILFSITGYNMKQIKQETHCLLGGPGRVY